MTIHALSIASLSVAALCSVILIADVIRRPQRMKIMNVVWPVSALYGGPLALLAYYTIGVRAAKGRPEKKPPLAVAAVTGSTHCGAGCTIGDVLGEFGVFFLGITIAGEIIWAYLVWDFVLAWLFGIVFQYFSIVPMRGLSFRQGVWAAIKADTLSIAAFQIGMYGWMIFERFVLTGRDIPPTQPQHWASMQIAMLIGFATTYPMNLWLIRAGLKETM